jgi:hypothetical protein
MDILVDKAATLLAERFAETARKASAEKEGYTSKLESADGDDVFKYLLLIDVSALESYVALTRMQAEQSFQLCKRVAIVGFGIIAVGISMGILSGFYSEMKMEIAYLTSAAGILTEFISGVFFYLYNRTLQQLNLFHNKLAATQQMSMSLLANSLISDDTKRDESKAELSRLLMSGTT